MSVSEIWKNFVSKSDFVRAAMSLVIGNTTYSETATSETFTDQTHNGNKIVAHLGTSSGGILDVTGIDFLVGNKVAISLSGLTMTAQTFNTSIATKDGSFYSVLIESMRGTLNAAGDDFDNLLEVGLGGSATVNAGGGDDLINVWHAKNLVIDGGSGVDTLDFDSYTGPVTPANSTAVVDLAKGTGTNPFGGTIKIKNVENVINALNGPSDLRGDDKDNRLVGGRYADKIYGRGGNDEIHMAANFSMDARATVIDGGSGVDTLYAALSEGSGAIYTGIGDSIRFHNKLDLENKSANLGTFHGATITNVEIFNVSGYLNKDMFDFAGTDKAEQVYSAGSDDVLNGRGGDDVLGGGGGGDKLTGGAGADVFQYQLLTDSTYASAGRDTITDFRHSQHDKIDISLLPASENFSGKYNFIGTTKFDGYASEVRYEHKGSDTFVYVDDNGDKKIDMAITLHNASTTLYASDFRL